MTKKPFLKKFIVALTSFLLLSVKSFSADFWLPAQIVIQPDGSLTHNFPFPLEKTDSMMGTHGFGVWPNVTGSLNIFKRIIAVDPKPEALKPENMVRDADGVMRLKNNRAGYRVIQHKNWNIGGGLTSAIFGSGMLLPAATLTLTGTYGRNIVASRWIKDFRNAKNLPKPKIPRSKQDLSKWHEEDFLSWTSTKDIAFAAGAGFGPAAVGATLMGSSTFNIGVKKLDKSKAPYDVEVTMERAKGKGWNVNASVMVAGAAYSKMVDKAKSWTYHFDLDAKKKAKVKFFPAKGMKPWEGITVDLDALSIYKEFLAGNLVPANVAAALGNAKSFGIRQIDETKTKTKTRSKSVGVSIPFLISSNYSKGQSFSVSSSKHLDEDTIGTTLLGVYNKEYETGGWLSKNAQRTRMFSGNYQKVAPIDPNSNDPVMRRYSGSYKYVYIRNKVDGKKLKKELKYLERKIGFQNQLKINIPDKIKLGTIQIELDLRISNLATDHLMNMAQKLSKNQFVNLGMTDAKQFFDGDWKYLDVCMNRRLTCQKKKTTQTKQAMEKAYNGLREMYQHKNKLDYKSFVKSFAKFGEGLIKNRFTFKTILFLTKDVKGDSAKSPATMMNLKISGTSLVPIKKDIAIY